MPHVGKGTYSAARALGTDPEDCQGPGVYWEPTTGECAAAPIPDCPNGTITQMTDAQGNPVSPYYCVPWATTPTSTTETSSVTPAVVKPSAPAVEEPASPTLGAFGKGALIVLGAVVLGTLVLA
jgi:hypothetical protein